MAVSGVAQVVRENYVKALNAFVANGVPYMIWATTNAHNGVRHLCWRRHSGADGTEVESATTGPYAAVAGILRGDGALLVVYTDGERTLPSIWATGLDLATGAVLLPPVLIAQGSSPTLLDLVSSAPGRHVLTFAQRVEGTVYVAETDDDGVTWEVRPVLRNVVAQTSAITGVTYDADTLTIGQVGVVPRALTELGHYDRTRPVVAIEKHPDLADTCFVVEATQRGTELADNLRGAICLDPTGVTVSTRARLGVDDGVADLMLLGMAANAPTLSSSLLVPAGATPGAGLVRYDLATMTPSAVREPCFPATTAAVVAHDCIAGHHYVAGYTDSALQGGLAVVRDSDGAIATPFVGAERGLAVAIREVPGDVGGAHAILAFAYEAPAGQYHLTLGEVASAGGDFFAPQWNLATHLLPARPQTLLVVATAVGEGDIYLGMTDRLNVYHLSSFSRPVRLVATLPLLTRSRILQMVVTPRGNLLCAMGEGGVAVVSPQGAILSQIVPSGASVPAWMPSTTVALGALSAPTAASNYTAAPRYFKATQAGTTGPYEPPWGPTGAIIDGGARWQDQGDALSYVTGVTFDAARHRVYAAGVLLGAAGTTGRVWALDAQGLL